MASQWGWVEEVRNGEFFPFQFAFFKYKEAARGGSGTTALGGREMALPLAHARVPGKVAGVAIPWLML